MRGSPLALPTAVMSLVILPKFTPFSVVLGRLRFTRLAMLKASARISKDWRSVIRILRDKLTSTWKYPGPSKLFAPELPKVPVVGFAKADGKIQQLEVLF